MEYGIIFTELSFVQYKATLVESGVRRNCCANLTNGEAVIALKINISNYRLEQLTFGIDGKQLS